MCAALDRRGKPTGKPAVWRCGLSYGLGEVYHLGDMKKKINDLGVGMGHWGYPY